MSYKDEILLPADGGTGAKNVATNGKVLIGNGTAFVPSTPTFPTTAGANGNVMTSDGTNWTSAAPSSGGGYALQMATPNGSPADGATCYLSPSLGFGSSVSNGSSRFYIPQAGTLNVVYGGVTCTAGSNENVTIAIRKNDTSNSNVTTTLQLNNASATFSNTSLGLSLAAGDFIDVLFICPTWVTNPSFIRLTITMFIS